MNPKVDFFFTKPGQWHDEYRKLRTIVLSCEGLDEELKWGKPCYALNGSNIVLIHGFKEYCALLFMKGALLNDTYGMLIQQTENVQAARQLRFTGLHEIEEQEAVIKSYIEDAITIERSGIKVELKSTDEFSMPAEFRYRLDHIPALKVAFEALTPGRQRAYLLHFSQPKQAKTREARVEKYMPWIMNGKGLNDE